MNHVTGLDLIRSNRVACQATACGPFTPIALKRYEFIGGERGWLLGYPTQTSSGLGAVCWSHRATGAQQ